MNGAKINFDIRSICSVCYLWWKFTLWLWMRVLSEMKLIELWFRRVHSPALPCPTLPPHQQFLSVSTEIQMTGTQNKAPTSVLTDDQTCTVRAPETHATRTTLMVQCICSDVSKLMYNKSLTHMFKDYNSFL